MVFILPEPVIPTGHTYLNDSYDTLNTYNRENRLRYIEIKMYNLKFEHFCKLLTKTQTEFKQC